MQYFQRVRGYGIGQPTRSGIYRRPVRDDFTADELFDFRRGAWERTMILQGILSGRRDGEVAEVTEDEIRAFLAEKHPALDADAVLAVSPPKHRLEA